MHHDAEAAQSAHTLNARAYTVGRHIVFGAGQYSMRLWVQPDKLAKLGITVTDIVNAVQAQNTTRSR